MGFFSKLENKVEDAFDNASDKVFNPPISPVQIAKKAEKQMRREKMVGAGKQFAPTLYTVLVNPDDDQRLFGYYPTLAGEIETYITAKATDEGFILDGQPLVRFIVDDQLRHGKFDVVAELVAAPIVSELREEEMQRYGLNANVISGNNQQFSNPNSMQTNHSQTANATNSPSPYTGTNNDVEANGYYDPSKDAGINKQKPRGAHAKISEGPASKSMQNVGDAHPNQQQPVPVPKTMVFPAKQTQNANAADDQAAAQQASQTNAHAYLTNESTGQSYPLINGVITIGRGSSCNVVLADINASRTHAELIYQEDGTWHIKDLNSTNGTSVNNRPVSSSVLFDGDQITIGLTTLLFTTS